MENSRLPKQVVEIRALTMSRKYIRIAVETKDRNLQDSQRRLTDWGRLDRRQRLDAVVDTCKFETSLGQVCLFTLCGIS